MAAIIYQALIARQIRRERIFRDRSYLLETLQDSDYIPRYRFPRTTILQLTDLIREDIVRPSCRSHPIQPHIQVMVTLRYLAKGDFLSEVADVHGISKSSASRCINSVCDAMCRRLNNIHFPRNNAEVREVKEKFYSLASFPNVIGAIDGTLIPIQGMTGTDENLYVCRKGFHALNIMAVADAKMRFININTRFPGASHDAYILMSSNIHRMMENLPEGGWLVGDSGYPLKTWLMTPLIHPTSHKEISYNRAHCKTRVVIERAFGVLKSRFRCIHKSGGALPFSPKKCSRIIETTFRLHNKAINESIPLLHGGIYCK
ncbi:LOW QUALITY PROTEIN: putative nuclease HARBI1 [Gigantopelta aegis]|uniref:LOW QUALITY PROTEIN: putative nuclease HARBI1 n=1 Tax=Gigantopelta aegis TaxID=1735272 RepID=UPI001B888355|nr:LOW QUALITY PROTEIN: putative nuclease HARBI1 [Gigantopelta aegis]